MPRRKTDVQPEPNTDIALLAAEPDESPPFLSGDDIINHRPDMNSPDWSEWVLSQMGEDELDPQRRPRLSGLYRMTEVVLGRVVKWDTVPCQFQSSAQDIAACTVEITVQDGQETTTHKNVGTCSKANCGNDVVANYGLEVAASRAAARCFRFLLKIKTVAAEEVDPTQPSSIDLISPEQIFFIDKHCRDLDISVRGFVNSGKVAYKKIKDVPHETARKMVLRLGDILRDKSLIMPAWGKYDADWRAKFE